MSSSLGGKIIPQNARHAGVDDGVLKAGEEVMEAVVAGKIFHRG